MERHKNGSEVMAAQHSKQPTLLPPAAPECKMELSYGSRHSGCNQGAKVLSEEGLTSMVVIRETLFSHAKAFAAASGMLISAVTWPPIERVSARNVANRVAICEDMVRVSCEP
jgi:hypothetical protein